MVIEIAAACDAATDQNGKLNILGAFDHIHAPLPFIYPQFAVAYRIRYQRSEMISHSFTLSIESPDGHAIVPPAHSQVDFGKASRQNESEGVANLIINLHHLGIQHEGKYLIRLRVNQLVISQIPLFVIDSTPKEPNPLEAIN